MMILESPWLSFWIGHLPSGNNRGTDPKTNWSKSTKGNALDDFWTSPKIAIQRGSLPAGNNREKLVEFIFSGFGD